MPYKNIIANIIAQEIVESGVKIPSLPDSAPRLMAMSRLPLDEIDIKDLETLIQSDPVLFAQILNLANSSYYRTGMEVTGLRTAIMRIGLTETMHSLYRYLFKNTLPAFPQLKGFSDKEYWEESWACAIANRRLGDPRLLVESLPGELYIAGLLHGLGKLILAVYDPKAYDKCIQITKKTGQPLEDVELKIFKTTGALVARKILESWNLPAKVCAAVAYWQSPESAEPEYREIAALTQFSCSIVKLSGLVRSCDWGEFSFPESFPENLSNTYVLKSNSFPLVGTGKHYKLVQEIVSILENHFAVIHPSPGEQKSRKTASQKTVTSPTLEKTVTFIPRRKGFFSWLRSLF